MLPVMYTFCLLDVSFFLDFHIFLQVNFSQIDANQLNQK